MLRFVAVAFQSARYRFVCLVLEDEVLWRRVPPVTYFGPALDPTLGGFGPQVNTNVRGQS